MLESGAALTIDGVSKSYGDFQAVREVSLSVPPGSFLTLLGPSGSGKTTLLMMIAGFVSPSKGRIRLGNADITDLPPERRNFGMVFQGYALFPTMTVRDNIGFPLRLRRIETGQIRKEVDRMLDLVELSGLGERMPRQLSGGQQQRVALARALVFNPKLLLLDEPLSALDKKLRSGLQEELTALHRRLGTTFIFVTHDQDEALSMSDEIAIVNHGRIVQSGKPRDLYDRPASRFVAEFLGRTNILHGAVDAVADGIVAYRLGGQLLRQRQPQNMKLGVGEAVLIGLRPEKIAISVAEPVGSDNAVRGTISGVTYLGTDYHLRVDCPLGSIQVLVPTALTSIEPTIGMVVWLSWASDASVFLTEDR